MLIGSRFYHDLRMTGMLVAECPSIPGHISQGRTEAVALHNIRAAHGTPLTIEV